MTDYDSIVIGAGHNGLICANYLARAGQRVLLLEAAPDVGGLAVEREFHPGFFCSVPHSFGGLSPVVVNELELTQHGYSPRELPLPLLALSPTEAPIRIDGDSLHGASTQDSTAYLAYRAQLRRFAKALAPFWETTLPRVGSAALPDLLTYGKLGLRLRLLGREDMLEFFRMATLPMRDLVEEFFEDERLKAALCWDGLLGSKLAPRSPNQAVLTLLTRMASPGEGQHGLPAGGVNGLVQALRNSAAAAGVTVRTSTPVRRVIVDGDEHGLRASGVELENGEAISAHYVLSSADPKTTFLELVGAPNLEIEFTNRIRRLRSDGYVAKVHLALSGLPAFSGVDDPRGRLLMAPTMDSIEFAYDDAKYGRPSEQPVLEATLPSLHTPNLAPPGQHVLSAHVMYVPGEHRDGWTDATRGALLERVLDTLEAHAPGLRELMLHAELLTPADLEQAYRVSGGHWHHGETAVDQLLMMRPTYEAAQYATPLPGLYLCGAGAHPGGDLTGNPGRNAARELLR